MRNLSSLSSLTCTTSSRHENLQDFQWCNQGWVSRPPLESLGGNFGRKGKGGKREGRGKKEEGREKRPKEKGKMEKKRRGILKEEEENLKWKGKVWKWAEDLFFCCCCFWVFFFCFCFVFLFWFFFFFCFSLFETTEICLGCTKMEISTGKKSGNGKFSNLAHLWLHTWLRPWGFCRNSYKYAVDMCRNSCKFDVYQACLASFSAKFVQPILIMSCLVQDTSKWHFWNHTSQRHTYTTLSMDEQPPIRFIWTSLRKFICL